MTSNTINRYGELDLVEFKAAIDKDLAKSERQLAALEAQLEDANESNDDQDGSLNQSNMGMLQTMANRQQKHILDLRNALQRIHNKSYGICIVTGELIDKRRLLAVPTTFRSLAAKVNPSLEKKPFISAVKPVVAGTPNKIISRIISKPKPAAIPITKDWADEEEDYDENDDLGIEEEFDFDSIVIEDTED